MVNKKIGDETIFFNLRTPTCTPPACKHPCFIDAMYMSSIIPENEYASYLTKINKVFNLNGPTKLSISTANK